MKKINIKRAVLSDFDFFFKIKSEKSNIFWTAYNTEPDYLNLQKWFISYLKTVIKNLLYGFLIRIMLQKKIIINNGYLATNILKCIYL